MYKKLRNALKENLSVVQKEELFTEFFNFDKAKVFGTPNLFLEALRLVQNQQEKDIFFKNIPDDWILKIVSSNSNGTAFIEKFKEKDILSNFQTKDLSVNANIYWNLIGLLKTGIFPEDKSNIIFDIGYEIMRSYHASSNYFFEKPGMIWLESLCYLSKTEDQIKKTQSVAAKCAEKYSHERSAGRDNLDFHSILENYPEIASHELANQFQKNSDLHHFKLTASILNNGETNLGIPYFETIREKIDNSTIHTDINLITSFIKNSSIEEMKVWLPIFLEKFCEWKAQYHSPEINQGHNLYQPKEKCESVETFIMIKMRENMDIYKIGYPYLNPHVNPLQTEKHWAELFIRDSAAFHTEKLPEQMREESIEIIVHSAFNHSNFDGYNSLDKFLRKELENGNKAEWAAEVGAKLIQDWLEYISLSQKDRWTSSFSTSVTRDLQEDRWLDYLTTYLAVSHPSDKSAELMSGLVLLMEERGVEKGVKRKDGKSFYAHLFRNLKEINPSMFDKKMKRDWDDIQKFSYLLFDENGLKLESTIRQFSEGSDLKTRHAIRSGSSSKEIEEVNLDNLIGNENDTPSY